MTPERWFATAVSLAVLVVIGLRERRLIFASQLTAMVLTAIEIVTWHAIAGGYVAWGRYHDVQVIADAVTAVMDLLVAWDLLRAAWERQHATTAEMLYILGVTVSSFQLKPEFHWSLGFAMQPETMVLWVRSGLNYLELAALAMVVIERNRVQEPKWNTLTN